MGGQQLAEVVQDISCHCLNTTVPRRCFNTSTKKDKVPNPMESCARVQAPIGNSGVEGTQSYLGYCPAATRVPLGHSAYHTTSRFLKLGLSKRWIGGGREARGQEVGDKFSGLFWVGKGVRKGIGVLEIHSHLPWLSLHLWTRVLPADSF